jgi:hypothetical protein
MDLQSEPQLRTGPRSFAARLFVPPLPELPECNRLTHAFRAAAILYASVAIRSHFLFGRFVWLVTRRVGRGRRSRCPGVRYVRRRSPCDVEPLSQAAKDAASSTAQNIYLVLSFFSFVVCRLRPPAIGRRFPL